MFTWLFLGFLNDFNYSITKSIINGIELADKYLELLNIDYD